MSGLEIDAAEEMRQRLQADLRSALKRRNALEISVIRNLVAAIDNAGAVPIEAVAPIRGEVARRRLDDSDVKDVLLREFQRYFASSNEFARIGRATESDAAELGAGIVRCYLEMANAARP